MKSLVWHVLYAIFAQILVFLMVVDQILICFYHAISLALLSLSDCSIFAASDLKLASSYRNPLSIEERDN